jgi:hypothetical protein
VPTRRRLSQEQQGLQQWGHRQTHTSIDAIMTFFAHPLDTAPAVIDEQTDEEELAEQDVDLPVAGSSQDDIDEGYQTGAVTAYETEPEPEDGGAAGFEPESGLYAFTNLIDEMNLQVVVNPVPATPSRSFDSPDTTPETATSPDPGTTPIQSPRPETTIAPTASPLDRMARIPPLHRDASLQMPLLDYFDADIEAILRRTRGGMFSHRPTVPDPMNRNTPSSPRSAPVDRQAHSQHNPQSRPQLAPHRVPGNVGSSSLG